MSLACSIFTWYLRAYSSTLHGGPSARHSLSGGPESLRHPPRTELASHSVAMPRWAVSLQTVSPSHQVVVSDIHGRL